MAIGCRTDPRPLLSSPSEKWLSEVVAEDMRDLKSDVKKELSQVRLSLQEDMKAQMDELTTEVCQQVKAATGKIERVANRLGEIGKNMAVSLTLESKTHSSRYLTTKSHSRL